MTTDELKPCRGFAWVGQSLAHCDRCGRAYWDHSYREQLNREAGPFDEQWLLVPITPAGADAARARWS